MGKLNIVKAINLTQYEGNPDPKYVTPLLIGNEPKNDIWQYYIENNRATCKKAQVTNANYDSLTWAVSPQTLPIQQRVRRIGIKTFPQVGAIGFFTLLNEERTKILAPIHTQTKKYNAPTLQVVDNGTTLSFTITDPKNTDSATEIKYVCYRIILRLGDFAQEYITYEHSLEVDKPATTGTYDIYCVGYIHEGEAVSEDSNHVYLAITGTQDTWPGPMEGSDLFITDVEVTDENKVHIRRSDGFQKDSDNFIPVPVSMSFLKSGKLQMTLNTGEILVSNNAPPGGGSSGGAALYLQPVSPVVPGVTSFKVQSDTLLADNITEDAFIISDNISQIEKLSDLVVNVKLAEAAYMGELVSLKANRDAYLNNNGISEELVLEVSEPTFKDLLGDVSLMTQIRTNTKNDDGIDTFTTVEQYYPDINVFPENYDPVCCKSFGISGNSFVNVGSVPHVININQRDAASYNLYKQEGIAEGVGFIKIRWNGASAYSGNIDSTWELYLLANGDVFLYIIDYPTNTGTCNLFGNTYVADKSNPIISFYRQDFNGMSFNIEYAMYDINKHNSKADQIPTMTIQGLVGSYAGMQHIRFNIKNDEGTDTCTFTDFAWNNLNKLLVSGNSWIGPAASTESIKFNRRDSSSSYVFMQKCSLIDVNMDAVRIVWGGSSAYKGAVDQWWELWLFENGDAMIYCKKLGSSSGTSSFYEISYNPSNGSYHSFYKKGDTWIKEDTIYDLAKHIS